MDALMTSELSDFCFLTNSLNVSNVVDISFGSFCCFGGSPVKIIIILLDNLRVNIKKKSNA